MPTKFDDPDHWANRAEESRAIAGQMRDLTNRAMMLEIASCYDRLAASATDHIVRAEKRRGGRVA